MFSISWEVKLNSSSTDPYMDIESKLKRELKKLFKKQRLAVLATQQNGQPYNSLVAFAATDEIKHLVFATSRSTRKYDNFSSDSRVALLIDNRSNKESDFHKAMAVTAVGAAVEVDENNHEQILKLYLNKHPHLEDFVKSPTCALVQVTIKAYYVVRTFQNVIELHMAP
jgi:nitroimidazol reductase NimA-like FMN-containing flavoprotein (pyridoxamine 5'-phosphate oxidase superfamily)